MTVIEQKELKGITIKNLLVTIISTASIVASVITSYLQLKSDIHDVKIIQETQTRIDDIRLKVLETQVSILQQEVDEMKPRANSSQSKVFSTINKSLIQ